MWYTIRNLRCTVTIDTVLANSKTECFLIHCERHFSSRLPRSGGTWKYAKAPSTNKTWRDSLPIDMLLSAMSVLVVAQSSSEIPERLMNNPVLCGVIKSIQCTLMIQFAICYWAKLLRICQIKDRLARLFFVLVD